MRRLLCHQRFLPGVLHLLLRNSVLFTYLLVALTLLMVSMPAVAASPMAAETTHNAPRFDQAALFQVVGSMYGVDPALLTAIAAVESHGDSSAMSPAGAQGLMQLMPATARKFHVSDPFDPIDNTLGAARYLDYLRRRRASRT